MALNSVLTVILSLLLLSTIGALGYTLVKPPAAELFTDFYLLGAQGNADDYPLRIELTGEKVTRVSYDRGISYSESPEAKVTVGLVNREQKETSYSISLLIDGEASQIYYRGNGYNQIEQIVLQHGQIMEQELGFRPRHAGEQQKVEFKLYKNDSEIASQSVYLWVDVKGQ